MAKGDLIRKVGRGVLAFTVLALWPLAEMATAGEIQVYDSKIQPAAKYPDPGVNGNIYYTVMTSSEPRFYKKSTRIKRCVLQHGHGVTNKVLGLLMQSQAPQQQQLQVAPPPAGANNNRPIGNLLRNGLQQVANMQGMLDKPELFARLYFGSNLLERLVADACDELVVVFRETTQTSALEIVRQTERFLRDVGCVVAANTENSEQRACAFIGHSLSGLAGTAIARRCMEAEKGQSELGEKGCQALAEVYGAAPINLGSTAAALVLGAKELNDTQLLKELVVLLMQDYGSIKNIVDRFTGGINMPIDLVGEYIPGQTNPIWMHLGPLAPMENDTPLYVAHKDLVIKRTGWFSGDYAVSGGALQYNGGVTKQMIGSGRIVQTRMLDVGQPLIFNFYSNVVGELHLDRFKRVFDVGAKAFLDKSPALAAAQPKIQWADFQVSDGVVERNSSLGMCEHGLADPESAVTSCAFHDNVGHLAMAGAAETVTIEIMRSLQAVGRETARKSF